MATHAQPLRRNRLSLLLARPSASRLLATLGIAAMTIGLYVPFAGRDVTFHSDPVTIGRQSGTWAILDGIYTPWSFLHMQRMSLALLLGVDTMYAVLMLGGLALIPLLWQPLAAKGTVAVRRAYGFWLVLLTIVAVSGLPVWWRFMTQPPSSGLPGITLEASYMLPGAVVFPLGVLVSCAALFLMLREPLPLSAPVLAPRTRFQWAGALVLTAGVLVWGIGFYLMPEAVTAACPPVTLSVTQFAHGACAGLDSDQVRAAAYSAGLNPIALLLDHVGGNFEFLVAAGCTTALGGWTRQLSVKTLAWLPAWPLLVLGVALIALQGVGAVAQRGFRLTVASGSDWHMASGMVVTFAGIGLVALGQLGLWREWVRRRSPASTQ
ncbi:MAG TPA: hypothetical protein VF040_02895 [Ktedonobacterales bacterium]